MTTLAVDRALESGPDKIIAAVGELDEDQWFERKSSRVSAKTLAIALVALANAEGGTIVVGIHDGMAEGIKGFGANANELRQASVNFTSPPVRVEIEQRPFNAGGSTVDWLLVLRVSPGEVVHELTNGECYLRIGDESRRLSFAMRQELHYDKGQAQFDGQPTIGVKFADLDQYLLESYRTRSGATRPAHHILQSRGLLTPQKEVSNGAVLLFHPNPSAYFPEAHVRILRYQGVTRETGSRQTLVEGGDQRLEGSIPAVIGDARTLIQRLQPLRRSLAASGTFEATPLIPEDAWLEGLVNAVIHRSYSLSGDHIRVEIFDDRIEIESPGRFPGLADPSRPLSISRFARNPRIARVCSDLRIAQELGEGIHRMFEEMRLRGLTDPLYSQTQSSVRLVLASTRRLDPDVAARLPKGADAVLDALRRASQPLGTGELLEVVGMSRPTLVKQLGALRDEGLINWVGKSPRDPRATWSIRPEA